MCLILTTLKKALDAQYNSVMSLNSVSKIISWIAIEYLQRLKAV